MNERIREIRLRLNLTQAQFAEQLGLSRNFISILENGDRNPSPRTISDICRIFGISEAWLKTGEGEMMNPLTQNQEIVEFLGRLMNDPEDAPRKRFIQSVAQLSEEEWQLLLEIAKKMAQE